MIIRSNTHISISQQFSYIAYNELDHYIHLKNKMDDFLNPDYSYDGLHLNGDGYKKWADAIQHLVK